MAARKRSPKKRGKNAPKGASMTNKTMTTRSSTQLQTQQAQINQPPQSEPTSPSSDPDATLPLPLDVIHRLLTENTPVSEPPVTLTSQVVRRLPFPLLTPVVKRLPYNFNETIDLCSDDENAGTTPSKALETHDLEDISDTSLAQSSFNSSPARSSKRGRSPITRSSSKSPTDPNTPSVTEIVLNSDTETEDDEIELLGIVTTSGSGMAGGGGARGSTSLSGRGKRLSKRARAGSLVGTPLGVQRNRNPGTPPRHHSIVRGIPKGVRGSRNNKMQWKRGQTRWGAELPIAKRRKSLQITAAMAATMRARGNLRRNNFTKDSPFMRRLENINPTHRGLIKHKLYGHAHGNASNQAAAPVPRTYVQKPSFVPNPVNGNNFHLFQNNPQRLLPPPPLGKPRPIVVDGSNVAVGHGGPSKVFSCRGLELMVKKIQRDLHHSEIVVFVPRFRAKLSESKDTYILDNLEKEGILKYTPSREVAGKRIASYDDRFIIGYAVESGGVVVSNDNFRDLYDEEPTWRETISNRLLQFTWVNDTLMFPNDPLGKGGPTLQQFLCFPPEPPATNNY